MVKNRIVMLQILNKPIIQKLIRLISVYPNQFTHIIYPKKHSLFISTSYNFTPLFENKNFCYKPQNIPSVTVLNWLDAFQMNSIMLPP